MIAETETRWDAANIINYRTPAQRYSVSRDAFVTLNTDGDWFVMACGMAEHRIARAHTTINRLAAHWAGFCTNCDVSR